MTVLSTACILQLLVPYHFEYRLLSGPRVLSEAFSYLPGAFLEELIFRGFLLVVFSQLLGWRLSLLIIALPFGLFHLQGGNGGYSIVISTTMCSFIFGLSFILTRSMWTSIASHATANIFLHVITGLDGAGTSVYKPVFEQAWPKQYDAGLLCMVAGAIIVTALLYILTLKKINSVNLNA
ncbi:CPBP family intramembrane glutamic endopeptidase [Mucilaginibacter terrae]|nr:CPBP family intramembrane glutamic endopeptidase [Mucilaginibacter terrae]